VWDEYKFLVVVIVELVCEDWTLILQLIQINPTILAFSGFELCLDSDAQVDLLHIVFYFYLELLKHLLLVLVLHYRWLLRWAGMHNWAAAILHTNFEFEFATLLKAWVGWRKITDSYNRVPLYFDQCGLGLYRNEEYILGKQNNIGHNALNNCD
jgi:hypothetical protein